MDGQQGMRPGQRGLLAVSADTDQAAYERAGYVRVLRDANGAPGDEHACGLEKAGSVRKKSFKIFFPERKARRGLTSISPERIGTNVPCSRCGRPFRRAHASLWW